MIQTYLANIGLQPAGESFGSTDAELAVETCKQVQKDGAGKSFVNAVPTFEIPGFKFGPCKSENQTEGKLK
jgi:hypothetical protein